MGGGNSSVGFRIRMFYIYLELFELHSRFCKKGDDCFENIRVTPRGVTEPRRINQ